DRRQDEFRVAKRRQRDENGAALRVVCQKAGKLDRETGLARASRADHRQNARIFPVDDGDCLVELALPTEEARRGSRELDAARSSQRREVPVADLIQTNCPLEVLQSMEAEIDGRYAVEEGDGRRGGDDLATVRERGDPGGAVDVYPDVALSAHDRRSGVQPYSDSDRTGGEGVQARRAPPRPRPGRWGRRRRRRPLACLPPRHSRPRMLAG